jgi:hypothetical protein
MLLSILIKEFNNMCLLHTLLSLQKTNNKFELIIKMTNVKIDRPILKFSFMIIGLPTSHDDFNSHDGLDKFFSRSKKALFILMIGVCNVYM